MLEVIQKIFVDMDPWEIATNTGVIAAVGTVVNSAIHVVINAATSKYYSRIKTYVIKTRALLPAELTGTNVVFRCLIIRYGTDQYIEKMASDIDRQNGKLQNRIINFSTRIDTASNETEFALKLPVHRRLGTQFKCFADIDEKLPTGQKDELLEKLKTFLESSKIVSDVSISSSEHQHRVYFLLNRFGSVRTVDGFENNHCFPH